MNREVTLALFYVLTMVLVLWAGLISALIIKQKQFFAEFTKGIAKKDLKSALVEVSQQLKNLDKGLEGQKQALASLTSDTRKHFQKSGFVRFNPYSDTGGDQSFCLCLLDDDNNGIVITSLHSREQTRIYAKAIAKGKVEGQQPSKEEAEAIRVAVGRK